jgi:LysM repeat protein
MAETAIRQRDEKGAAEHYRQAVIIATEGIGAPYDAEVDTQLAQGDQAAKQKDYRAAIEHYRFALDILTSSTPEAASGEAEAPVPAEAQEKLGSIVYTVQPGDTVSKLAVRFNTTVEEIVALNNLEDSSIIEVGQRLIIPTTATTER